MQVSAALLGALVEGLSTHPDVGVITLLGIYLVYEVRIGRIKELHDVQSEAAKERRLLGVAVYKIVRDDDDFDEARFRDLLWGDEEDQQFFPEDLAADGGDRRVRE